MAIDVSPLFKPFECKSLKLRNRTVMAPMTRSFSPGNVPNDDNVAYYARRAAGEVGLIVTEGTEIRHEGASGYPNVPHIYGDEAMAGWKKVVDAVHAEGGQIIPQLWHVGAVRKPESDDAAPAYSPSGLYAPGKPNGKAMTKADIDEVIAGFAHSAKRAIEVGFDGVEIHGAHGYLIDQFFWAGTNQRDDEYGGSFENRCRFAIELVRAVRAAIGEDKAIVFRFSQWKMQDYDARLCETPEQLETFLSWLSDAGVDVFHASQRRFWEPEFEGSDLNLAGWVQKLTGKPAISVGSVGLTEDFISGTFASDKPAVETRGIDDLMTRMAANEFDLIAIGRALLQDPDWVKKIREGREDEVDAFSKASLQQLY
ncbi:NADH:flavin oxidoreductase [Pseudidiomarina taiwanensis]|uniref:12-oxophytodienoate reductase n=1 Tax=Pseudidiomarina taiwanensis TaxID=337250 RepID=A0A432ZFR2_9GAMM|nr:NADH:flavin oxidoreductase [Pseudidiomarina taiwanensis]RUO76761.1 12-oxophytodienoate reductase [Pseudidiomarina taiwanensis]